MRLLAIADLHFTADAARAALSGIPPHPGDWLILAGDIGERMAAIETAFEILTDRFERVLWVPGNHDLWTMGDEPPDGLRGVAAYEAQVETAHHFGILTPEDPYTVWPGPVAGPHTDVKHVIAPLFLLFDYGFRPAEIARPDVRAWAREAGSVSGDELRLKPDPYPDLESWCAARVSATEKRLDALAPETRTVLINHWPLRDDLIHLPRAPRFGPWCGTPLTRDWHRRYRASVAVHGHLHTPRTDWRDGTRFEEVSLGSRRQWDPELGVAAYFREILPGPDTIPPDGTTPETSPVRRRRGTEPLDLVVPG